MKMTESNYAENIDLRDGDDSLINSNKSVPQTKAKKVGFFLTPISSIFAIGIFILLFLSTFWFALDQLGQINFQYKKIAVLDEEVKITSQHAAIILSRYKPFDGIDIAAQAAVVYDVSKDRVMYERNINLKLPLASITKIVTAITALKYTDTNRKMVVGFQDTFVVGNYGLVTGEYWSFQDLINFTLMSSSNVGATVIARNTGEYLFGKTGIVSDKTPENYFVGLMNETTTGLGLTSLRFKNVSGLDVNATQGGAYGTVLDVAHLMEYVVNEEPNLLKATTLPGLEIKSDSGIIHNVRNTNQEVVNIPGIIASKTGFTDLSGGNLVIAYESEFGSQIIIVVLGSDKQGRFIDVQTLFDATEEVFSSEIELLAQLKD